MRSVFFPLKWYQCGLIVAVSCLFSLETTSSQQPPSPEESAIAAVTALKDSFVKGDLAKLGTMYHDNAMLVGPSTLSPIITKKAILISHKEQLAKEKTTYFHLRQPQAAVLWQSAIVVTNYETGWQEAGKLTETNGKAVYVLSGDKDSWLLATEVLVPNANAGTYGPMGTALTSRPWGVFPRKAIPPPGEIKDPQFDNPSEKELYETTKKINATFPMGDIDKMLQFADDKVSIWAGDYGPVYLWGPAQARQHFADFFKTGKMREIKMFRPEIRVYGGIGVVYFQFEETLEVYNKVITSPGQAVYGFSFSSPARLIACTETALVKAAIGDPYPPQR